MSTLSVEIKVLASMNAKKANRRRMRYLRLYDGQRLIAISNGVAQDLRDGLGIRHSEIVTVYRAMDFEKVRKLAALPEQALPDGPYVLHAARFAPQKRHDLLLDAFAMTNIPHSLVLLTNGGPQLHAMIASRNLQKRVIVAGFRANIYPWFANAAAFVLSSDREGMPNVLIDALVCGTPVVSTDCPSGPREILTGTLSEYLVPCGDAVALAECLQRVIASPPTIMPSIIAPFAKQVVLDKLESLADRAAA